MSYYTDPPVPLSAAEINALPEPVRRWIHDLETRWCDPAGDLRKLRLAQDENRMLRAKIAELHPEGSTAYAGSTVGFSRIDWARCRVDVEIEVPDAHGVKMSDKFTVIRLPPRKDATP